MKRIAAILLLFLSFNLQAQQFKLTPAGFADAANIEHPYIVLHHPESSKETLYEKTLVYLHTIYKNPDKVLSTVENETITVNGYAPNSVHRNKSHVFNMDYSFVIRFKEGKIRIDAPSTTLTDFTSRRQTLHIVYPKTDLTGIDLGIYGKKNKLKSPRAKQDLETYFNTLILGYSDHLLNDNANNDW